jgi:hypothetical protein
LLVFIRSRSFAHEHEFGIDVAGSEHDVRSRRRELTALAVADIFANEWKCVGEAARTGGGDGDAVGELELKLQREGRGDCFCIAAVGSFKFSEVTPISRRNSSCWRMSSRDMNIRYSCRRGL